MKSSTYRAALVLLVTFAAGVAAGVAAERLWLAEEPPVAGAAAEHEAGGEKDDRGHHGDRPRTTIERFADELGLTPDQRARIEDILSRHREEMHEMWSQIRPRFRRLMDSARADIEAVLTEEQTEQYRQLLEREHGGEKGWKDEPDAGRSDTAEGG